jgi:hypothetical protein
MATFLLCWAVVSVVGTLIALTLINSGKRNSRKAEAELNKVSHDTQIASGQINS